MGKPLHSHIDHEWQYCSPYNDYRHYYHIMKSHQYQNNASYLPVINWFNYKELEALFAYFFNRYSAYRLTGEIHGDHCSRSEKSHIVHPVSFLKHSEQINILLGYDKAEAML